MRIHLSSLGCKLNQSEIDDLARRLAGEGHTLVGSAAEAEVCILNTCAVTHVAAQKSRQALGHLHRENPAARLVAAGCCAELAAAELARLPGVAWVAGNRDKERLPDWLGAAPAGPPAGRAAPPARTRGLVKIQDGCDNTCTYCIVRVARGPQRSRPPAGVLADVRARVAAGCVEVVLTGVHIGAYGRDASRRPYPEREDRRSVAGVPWDGGDEGQDRPGTTQDIPAPAGMAGASDGKDTADLDEGQAGSGGTMTLWSLVALILAETGVPRLRLSSVEPWDLPAEALGLWADARLCRHLHLPLQSGSDAVLRRMGRRYTTAQFAALVAAARAAIPGLAVTTDVIAGFPGETDAEFEEGLAFIRALAPARAHVFPYSARDGTPAARLPGQVPPAVKAERARRLRAAGAEGELAFRRSLVGQTLSVLWETARPDPGGEGGLLWSGLTDNYARVQAPGPATLANTVTPTHLLDLAGSGLRGRIER